MAVADLNPAAAAGPTSGSVSGTDDDALLAVSDLQVSFRTPHGVVDAVRGVSFSDRARRDGGDPRRVRLRQERERRRGHGPPRQPAGADHGRDPLSRGIDLLRAPIRETRRIHGDRVAMINQDAVTALNPGLTVGYQIGEMFRVHRPGHVDATTLGAEGRRS